MKTITGKVLSTTPISLSKAASILSKFVSVDTGASQAVCAYLRRAAASFNELAQLHKELKSNRKHRTSKSGIVVEEEKPTHSVLSNQPLSQPEVREVSHGIIDRVGSEIKKHKKNKKKENGVQIIEDEGGIKNEENQGQVFDQSGKNKQTKKMVEIGNLKEDEVKTEIEEDVNVRMVNERKKHNKKRGDKGFEISNLNEKLGGTLAVKEKTMEKKKKRKSGEIEEGREMHSEESPKKKKKRKT